MSTTDPNELDEEAQPNRWPFAIAISVFLHAVILCEVLISVWPETPGSSFRPAPLIPLASEKTRPSPSVAEQAALPTPEPEQPGPITAATTPAPEPVVTALAVPAANPAAKGAAPPRRQTAMRPVPAPEARRHLPPPQPAVERARYAGPTAPRREAAPAYASVGDWFRAMSRMRQGDFAPNRGH